MKRPVRLLLNIVPLIIGWVLITAAIAAVIRPEGRPAGVSIALTFGVAMGLAGSWFELVAIPRYARRLSARALLALRTAFYAGVASLYIVVTVSIAAGGPLGVGSPALSDSSVVRDFLTGRLFGIAVLLIVLASFGVNLLRQIGLVLGPGTLWALFSGRYRVPVREQRAFLFLDLSDSTGLAQTLGPDLFHSFKNEFFRDIVDPILDTHGQIMQYVGDEVVVTWQLRNGKLRRHPIETFFLVEDAIAKREDDYRNAFGVLPAFKAALHCGEVVTAEVGELKKDIVHSGDPVNVTARIEGECHAYDANLLVSEEALHIAPLPSGVTIENLGTKELRGREGLVRLFKVSRSHGEEGSLREQRLIARTQTKEA